MKKELASWHTQMIDPSLPFLSRLELKIKNCMAHMANFYNKRAKSTWICEADSLEDAYQNRFKYESYPPPKRPRPLLIEFFRNKNEDKRYLLHISDVKFKGYSGNEYEKSVIFSDYTRELTFKAYNRRYLHLVHNIAYPVYIYAGSLDEEAWMLLDNLVNNYNNTVEIGFTFVEGQFYLSDIIKRDDPKGERRLNTPSPIYHKQVPF